MFSNSSNSFSSASASFSISVEMSSASFSIASIFSILALVSASSFFVSLQESVPKKSITNNTVVIFLYYALFFNKLTLHNVFAIINF